MRLAELGCRLTGLTATLIGPQVENHVRATFLVAFEGENLLFLSGFQQLAEVAESVILLVEGGLNSAHRLLHQGAPNDVAVLSLKSDNSVGEKLEEFCLLLVISLVTFRGIGSFEIFVEDKLVTAFDEKAGGAVFHADAQHSLIVLSKLVDQGSEVGVAGGQDEGVEVGACIAEVEGVNDHSNVCRVFASLMSRWDLKHFDAGRVELQSVVLKRAPVGVSPAEKDSADLSEAPEYEF